MIKINLYGIWNMFRKKENTEEKLMLKSRAVSNGLYEVNGVMFYADSHAEALRKYRRGTKL